ncbi:MAG TPA: CvpA family protein [Chloroflexota bacterium]|nr:CvpA family protein [Chloroflexota bacterium]
MSLNFTELALAIIIVFGVLGWVRGARRVSATTGGIFFAMTVVSVTGPNILQFLARSGITFHPKEHGDLFLALLFLFTVYIVQLTVKRAILGGKDGLPSRQQRLTGLCLGFLNGFLLVANVVRYADPFLRKTVDSATGGWTWLSPFPHLTHASGSSVTLALGPTPISITPSPLLQIYSSLPTALILLFGFLIVVFVGTVYGRVTRGRR